MIYNLPNNLPSVELEFEDDFPSFTNSSEISVYISEYHILGANKLKEGQEEFKQSQQHRLTSLIRYKEFGEALLVIQEKLKGATKTSPITTDLGVFTSFEDYLRQYYYDNPESTVKKTQARKYMFLAKHWYVAEAIKLFDEKGCYRLEATLKVIRWALDKEEEGCSLEDLNHDQFFAELYSKKEPKEQSSYLEEIRSLRAEVERLLVENAEVERLRAEVAELKAKFNSYRVSALV